MSVPSVHAHLPMALPPPAADLARVLAMRTVAADRSVQRPLGPQHLLQEVIRLNDFLSQLLPMLRVDDNGSGPGVCMRCDNCGRVRLRWVWLALVDDNTVALKGFCPRCRGRLEARLEV